MDFEVILSHPFHKIKKLSVMPLLKDYLFIFFFFNFWYKHNEKAFIITQKNNV